MIEENVKVMVYDVKNRMCLIRHFGSIMLWLMLRTFSLDNKLS